MARSAAIAPVLTFPAPPRVAAAGCPACARRQGDVYVGSRWNMLTLLMGLTFFVPVFGLLFAFLSYGTLWTGHYYGI